MAALQGVATAGDRAQLRRVLLVEDDLASAEMYALALEQGGFGVDIATTAAEALAAGRQMNHDLILLDIGLPDRPGLEVLGDLGVDPGIPPVVVAMFSNYNEPEMVQRALDLGASRYMVKADTTPATLLATVADLCATASG